MALFGFLLVTLVFSYPFIVYGFWKSHRAAKLLSQKLETIDDAEAEAARIRESVKEEAENKRAALTAEIANTMTAIRLEAERASAELVRQRSLAQAELDDLRLMVEELGLERAALDEALIPTRLNLAVHAYEDSDAFAAALVDVRERQKYLVKDGLAATCSTTWSVGGDEREGDRMTKRTLDLMLRAFNGECDGAISKASAVNEGAISARIAKAAAAINRLGTKQYCSISDEYVALKLEELAYVCARQLALAREKEEQRAIREQMREEAIRAREVEQAEREAQADEDRFEKALTLARRQLECAQNEQRSAFEDKVRALELQLADAHAKMQRAVSQAQLTRAGHVYIISNLGSFGEHVYKVGMTRRLDPQDRIDELGDASVPFRFDVHAMIYSTDAPSLEKALHDGLERHRVNRVNPRKEFFRTELDVIRQIAEKHHGEFRLTLAAEAAEYRMSLDMGMREEVLVA